MYRVLCMLTIVLIVQKGQGRSPPNIPGYDNHCVGLEEGPFVEECASKLDASFVSYLCTHCYALADDLVKIRLLLDTVEEICRQQYVDVKIVIPDNDANLSNMLLSNWSSACVDLVFMVDASNSVGLQTFNTFKVFLTHVIEKLDTCEECTKVSVLAFSNRARFGVLRSSNTTEITTKVQSLQFMGRTTRTDEAIKWFNLILRQRRKECLAVGVMFMSGKGRDWRATLNRLTALYKDNTGAEFQAGVRMVVVALDDTDVNTAVEARAMASGINDDNLFMIADVSQLDSALCREVVNRIEWDGVTNTTGCTQWVVLNTVNTRLGDSYVGVYEKTASCNGNEVFIHTSGKWWLSSLNVTALGGQSFWSVFGQDPSAVQCEDPQFMVAILIGQGLEKPSAVDKVWLEFGLQQGTSAITVKCFN